MTVATGWESILHPAELDPDFVPVPIDGLTTVTVGDETVILHGWTVALALNAIGTLIWSWVDGKSSLRTISRELAIFTSTDEAIVMSDVIHFIGIVGQQGLISNIDVAEHEDFDIQLEAVPSHTSGDTIDDIELRSLDGTTQRSRNLNGSGLVLLVNWNPQCGYCAQIASDLAAALPGLNAVGCKLVLAATGSGDANNAAIRESGLTADIALLGPGQDLFRGAGTPSAYYLDSTGRIIEPPAYGAKEVPALARRIAGTVDPHESTYSTPQIRYLLTGGGACEQTIDNDRLPIWAGTNVYEINGFHVGIRYNSSWTSDVLDRLFLHRNVSDMRAGHSFSVALHTTTQKDAQRGIRELNLLIQPGLPPIRSRDPSRVLHALLSSLSENTTTFDPTHRTIQTRTLAAIHSGGAALLPWELTGFAPRIQGLLAREGIALADVHYPEVNVDIAELFIPEPNLSYDHEVVDEISSPPHSSTELQLIGSGHYPLTAWFVVQPGPLGATTLSRAEAAAAVLSVTLHATDPPSRMYRLGQLFHNMAGIGLWYNDEAEVFAAIAETLHHQESLT